MRFCTHRALLRPSWCRRRAADARVFVRVAPADPLGAWEDEVRGAQTSVWDAALRDTAAWDRSVRQKAVAVSSSTVW